MVESMTGRVITSLTIDRNVREELKKMGIPLGSACAMWLKAVEEKKDYNEQINKMTENIAKMQDLIRRQSERIHELENPEKPKE